MELSDKWVAVISIWITIFCLVLYFLTGVKESRERLMSRMLFGLARKKSETGGLPFIKRFFRTVLSFGSLVASKRTLVTLQDRIDAAGNPWHLTAAELTGMKMITGTGAAILIGYAEYLLQGPPAALLMAIVIFLLFQVLPSFLLGRAVTGRKTELERQLPNFMDIVTLSVESGLGLDAAMATAIGKFGGPVAQEFGFALQEIKYGIPRRTALLNIAQRNKEIKSLRNVLVSMVQAERFGMSVSQILRVQSSQLRIDKRSRVEEAVQKMPVKMLFPLILLILPALFGVILGPALIAVINAGVF
ncbi:MAG TPA: type II secretion system F family protein [Spirochaetia bacterium]|nr:type II secretion system F family protein [Spirochaetia bacterium]